MVASLKTTLPRNALVRRFAVRITADPALRVKAVTAAQVRPHAGGNSAVIDFGVPRTVSEISITSTGTNIKSVTAWNGSAFATSVIITAATSVAFAEVRSERFLVEFSKTIAKPEDELSVFLPELPADLEIRINGGPPVWTHSGPALRTAGSFNAQGKLVVELGDALGALLGDPLSEDTATFDIRLTSRVPGTLKIEKQAELLAYVKRVLPEKVLDFAEEGEIGLVLPLPKSATPRVVEEVRLTAIGNPPPERTMPVIEPPPVTAELVLDSEHAACVRLRAKNDEREEIDQLTAVRLPLTAEGDGAEVHVVLWEDEDGGPSAPMPGGVSKPVTVAPSDQAEWIRFEFPKAVPIDGDPWVAVLASRGTAIWELVDVDAPVSLETPDDVLVPNNEVRRGGPNGPWETLPAPFLGPFIKAAGRVRVTGIGAKESPVAPLLMTLSGEWNRVTPTAKGAPVTIAQPTTITGDGPLLTVVSRTAGSVTLRNVDVVWHPELLTATTLTQQSFETA